MGQETEQGRGRRRSRQPVVIVILSLLLAGILGAGIWMYTEGKDRIQDLSSQISRAEETIGRLESLSQTLEAENEMLYKELNESKKSGEEVNAEVESLQRQLEEKEEEILRLQEEAGDLQDKLEKAYQTLEELQNAEPAEKEGNDTP